MRIQSPASWASISTRIKTYKLLLPTYIPTTRIQSPASWASISTRIKTYKLLLPTYIPTTTIQSPASWASISTRIKTYKLLLPTYRPTTQTAVCKIFEAQHQTSISFEMYILQARLFAWHVPVCSLKTRLHFSALHLDGRRSRGASRKSTCNVSSK